MVTESSNRDPCPQDLPPKVCGKRCQAILSANVLPIHCLLVYSTNWTPSSLLLAVGLQPSRLLRTFYIQFWNLLTTLAFTLEFSFQTLKPGFHIIAPVATVATVANKIIQRQERLERRERFLGFHIIAIRSRLKWLTTEVIKYFIYFRPQK